MVQDFSEYFSELFNPPKNLYEKYTLRNRLAKAMHTAHLLSSEGEQTLMQANEFYKYIDAHINLLKGLPKVAQYGIKEQCKKILYIMYTDVRQNEAGTELYKHIAAQAGLYPKIAKQKLHLSDKEIKHIHEMAFVAITDGRFDEIVKHTEKRIKALEELRLVIHDLQTLYYKEQLNRKVIEPLKEIELKYWTRLTKISEVERELNTILHRRKDALKQNAAHDAWEHVTGGDCLLQSLRQCAALNWYERREELTGQQFKYGAAFTVAVRERAKQSLFGEVDFDLHKRASDISNIPLYWGKDVLSGGKTISESQTLIDREANRQFLVTTKDINTDFHPLIDGEANAEFLECHYSHSRHNDDYFNCKENEEYLRFKTAQRRTNTYYYIFDR